MVTKICSVPNQIEDSADKTFTSGVGLVVAVLKPNIEEDSELKIGKKVDLLIQVNHSDWDPIDRLVKTFNVKYIVPANPKLVNTHIMIRVGREFTFDGYLSGWDLKECMAIITVLGFSPINMGASSPNQKTNPYSPKSSPGNKGRRFITFEEHEPKTAQASTESSGSNAEANHTAIPFPSTSQSSSGAALGREDFEPEPIAGIGLNAKGKNKAVEFATPPKKRRGAPGSNS
ncbi:uncharacterized protein PGTG_03223 [Puccinia graminis f. sp. tritici CRL 75-36-700-3]|uniref:Uncharacterized protein n=1 Tax=Puccinia graminis f. sp. tritici (strain CRL 75-36-700-3 / race SCCL) TaxID=418459 RepID=E3JYZ2_PUCGT|nr:uncharacterized protein PGTG_03223 [Puccinia graminis f. sp. tritici CRL 75-36-700-3]EFP77267.2 hypothetical protein PGTG_03223 [Puccinia graminis f. sp. tritici CRL 75-36-700-3]